jgi:CubicO group peptidase (beta-lactamase class C family)
MLLLGHARRPHLWTSGRAVLSVLAAVVVAVSGTSPAAAIPSTQGVARRSDAAAALDIGRIDRYLRHEMRRHGLPGLAVGIVEGDHVVHTAAFGEGISPETPVVLASVSKPMTATAVLQLVDAGRVALDDPVQKYVPDFRVSDLAASARITVRQLLNHTSGIPTSACEIEADTIEAYVRHLRRTSLDRGVGTKYEYCSGNYTVLGLLVQRVSGMSFARYMDEAVFRPLEMKHSFAAVSPARRAGLAHGHQWLLGFKVADEYYNASDVPGGYVIASAQDMTHFLIAHLNDGRYGTTSVLSAGGVAASHAPSVAVGSAGSYGLGWMLGNQGGTPAVYHYGTNYDVETFVVLEPQVHRGAVLLVSGQSLFAATAIRNVETGLARLLAGEAPPPAATNVHAVYALLDAVLLLALIAVVVPLARLRRWARRPAASSHRRRGWTRAGAETVLGVFLIGGLRFVFVQIGANWFEMFRALPDFTTAIAVLSALLMATGVTRALTLLAIRPPA